MSYLLIKFGFKKYTRTLCPPQLLPNKQILDTKHILRRLIHEVIIAINQLDTIFKQKINQQKVIQ